ncbi:DUF3422 domain-containing protein [Aquincola sp. S2]|uniref:DUF3422 domain-containing protein n=1 Tax=Pseudaquabacterium terrae TaxID=2732868 RepID=A0ABX2EG94_9BURK|nr:DUF3422 domain-containing protein [Aquabacterium terrae]NRF67618.1 DUF3422 domain-containing protein [Aquabacterium terrae]
MDPTHHTGLPFPARTDLELHQELHARPALAARPPCVVSYWVHTEMAPERADGALSALCLSLGLPAPAPGVRHQVVQAPPYTLKFERHGEFVSWQVNRPLVGLPEATDDQTLRTLMQEASALTELPDAFVAQLTAPDGGHMLAAAHVVMLQAHDSDDMLRRCQALLAAQAGPAGSDDAAPLMGAFIGDARRGALLTHLRLGRDGFTRFIVLDFGLPHDQAAREAQRLCEIEAYRMLAMQGFPVAQRESALLAELERTLQGTVDAMANDVSHDDAQAFETLTKLAAEVEHGTARTRYRFSATRAYHAIVERRLSDLREQRISGVQTLSGFLSRRFAPAMALCESTDGRLTDLGERINRATSLARIRIEVRREEGNQELLRALAQRQKQQLQLQQTVEGLSVVAISYYALGLIGYLAKGAKTLPAFEALHLPTDAVVGLSVVPVVAAVTWFVHRLRRHWSH